MIYSLKIEEPGVLCVSLPKPKERRKKVTLGITEKSVAEMKKLPKGEVVILSQPKGEIESKQKEKFVISTPGEYEVQGVFFHNIPTKDNVVVFTFQGEDKRGAYLFCNEKLSELDAKIVSQIGNVGLLIVSFNWQSPPLIKSMKSVLSQIDPAIIVFLGNGKKKTEEFLKEMDVKNFQESREINLETADFKEEKQDYYVLQRE